MKRLVLAASLVLGFIPAAFGESKVGEEKPLQAPSPAAGAAAPATSAIALDGIDAAVADLQKDPVFGGYPVDWVGILSFYAANGSKPIWTVPGGYTPLGQALIAQLPKAAHAGMTAPQPLLAAVAPLTPATDAAGQARAEALLSAVFTGMAIDSATFLGPDESRGAGILIDAEEAKDPAKFMALQLPDYYRFWGLMRYLPVYIAYYENGGWGSVPKVDKIEPGKSSSAIPAIRRRLLATGELQPQAAGAAGVAAGTGVAGSDTGSALVYDPALAAAVATFQRNHGLNDDGVIGARTIEEMNVPAEKRLLMIMLNLQRMRAEGPKFEPRHIVVNIPSQEAKVIGDGKVEFFSKAIVGKVARKTPTLSSVIHTAKLNPDWTAPVKIAAADEVRRQRADPNFLQSHGFHVFDQSGNEVSITSIDWHEVGPGNFPYTLRQEPGPENALGPVKLDFPNDYAVYLHGTNQRQLFAKQDRFFSSGCVRLQQPVDLAEFLLRDNQDWPRARIDEVIAGGKTTYVTLKTPMPVHIVYMTAWADEDGVMQFRKDMYGYDRYADIPEGLRAPATAAPAVATQQANLGSNR